MIGQPMMNFFQKKVFINRIKAGANLSAVLVLIIFITVATVFVWLFVPLVVEQAAQLSNVDLNAIMKALEPPMQRVHDWLSRYGVSQPIKSPTEQLQDTLFSKFDPTQIANFFSDLISILAGLVVDIFSILFITFFFLKEQGLFVNFLIAMAPNQYEDQIQHAVEDASQLLTRYFGGILIQITIITIVVTAGLSLLGIKNALLIGIFAALINVIPYVGPIIGALFGIFVTISSNLETDFYAELLPLIGKVAGVFAFMQLLDNFVLQPLIFSNSVLAHPLEIFIVILMGATIHGITGMVLAIPAYTVIRLVARIFLSEFRIVQKLTGSIDKLPDKTF